MTVNEIPITYLFLANGCPIVKSQMYFQIISRYYGSISIFHDEVSNIHRKMVSDRYKISFA